LSVADHGAHSEAETLSALIGDICDTTLDRSLWPHALRKTTEFVRGAASAVFWNDAANSSGDIYLEDGGIAPHYRDLYFEKYVKLNPTTTPRFFAEAGEPVATADLVPYDEFLRTRFYLEWAKPQGLVDFVSVTLEKSAIKSAMFGVFRHERNGIVDEEMRRRVRLVGPHIRRAVLIAGIIDLERAQAETFVQTLDNLRAAALFVDAGGRIVHVNSSGRALLDRADVLHVVAGKLVSGDRPTDERLREIFQAAAHGDAALGGTGIALPLMTASGERYLAHVLPLTSGARQGAGSSLAATAALFVQRATMPAPSPPEAIAKTYMLTLTELRVLLAIVEVGGVPKVADVLGIAASTVRTHLGRVYLKTGTQRQADLVKLVAGFSSPFAT
jgi:DNA-binding CsgD family transcriptional regulator